MGLLKLEPLEAREVPSAVPLAGTPEARGDSDYSAIVFVGGWGSSMYQYAYHDPNAASLPTDQIALNNTKVELDPSAKLPATDDVIVDGRIING